MNWSLYSRFVGDIFGAPLAFEALLAFFLESTFPGCGSSGGTACPQDPPRDDLAHPPRDGLRHTSSLPRTRSCRTRWATPSNPKTNRAELDDFLAVLTNKVQLSPSVARHHRCVHDRGAFVMGVALSSCASARSRAAPTPPCRCTARPRASGPGSPVVAGLAVVVTGDLRGRHHDRGPADEEMAAAEALYESSDGHAPFSLFTIGSLDGKDKLVSVEVPGC